MSVFEALIPEIQQAISEAGYTAPTPIQEKAIPHLLKGADLFGCAQTGTGKTAAFSLPILNRLEQENVSRSLQRKYPRALILTPTRELAAQIDENITKYAKHTRVSHTVIFGGVSLQPQIDRIGRGVAILTATPGRLLDLVNQKALYLDHVDVVVLDEADRMLDMGFLPAIKKIIALLPTERQSLFFSATLSDAITKLAKSFIRKKPVEVRIAAKKPTVERINQRVLFVDKENKYALLKSLLDQPQFEKVIIFSRMKHFADRLAKNLKRDNYSTGAIHGDKSQNARIKALEGFKKGDLRILVATDIAARGIDVDDVTHVINFDLPEECETYVHRIGRTARAGASGEALSLVCAHDRNALRDIEKFISLKIPADLSHPLHSETAKNAMGADASFKRMQRPPRAQRPANVQRDGSIKKPRKHKR